MSQIELLKIFADFISRSFVRLEIGDQVKFIALLYSMQYSCVVYCTCSRSSGYSMHTENVHVVHSIPTELQILKLQKEWPVSMLF